MSIVGARFAQLIPIIAIALALGSLQGGEQSWESIHGEINAAIQIKDFVRAETLCRAALLRFPNDEFLPPKLTGALREQKRFAAAIEFAEDARRRFPKQEWLRAELVLSYINLVQKLLAEGQSASALKATTRAREIGSDFDYVHLYHALALSDSGRFFDSLAVYREAAARFPKYTAYDGNYRATFWKALKYFTDRKDRKALERLAHAAQEAMTHYSDWERVHDIANVFAHASQDLGEVKQFRAQAALLRGRFPNEPDAYDWSGWHLMMFTTHKGTLPGDAQVLAEAIVLRRQAMAMVEARHPFPIQRGLAFPLRGRIFVAGPFDANAVTHTGYHKYSYDLMLADTGGSTLRSGSTGKENAHYYCFGSTVYAVLDGTVELAQDGNPDQPVGRAGPQGNAISIVHAGGLVSYYDHLQLGSVGVRTGQQVRRGEPIARVGNSGATGGPHLHFSLHNRKYSLPFRFPPAVVLRAKASLGKTEGPYLLHDVVVTDEP